MKRTFILVVMAFLLVGSLAFADEAVLIDFTLMEPDIVADENGNPTQNGRTVMDFSVTAGATFTDEQKDLMKTSLAMPNWEVELNSSARNINSLTTSTVVSAPVRDSAKVPFAGKDVMGVRILFPSYAVNSNARIVPAFEIPAYEPMATADEDGNIQPQTDEEKANVSKNVNYVTGNNVTDARVTLQRAGFNVKVVGSGNTVVSQFPTNNMKVQKGSIVVLYTDADTESVMVTMPDLTNKSAQSAESTMRGLGLNITYSGVSASASDAVVISQAIPSGEKIPMGTVVEVNLTTTTAFE